MKLCPFCAEEVQDAAVRCKHCQADLTDSKAKWHAYRLKYEAMSPEEKKIAFNKLDRDQQATFRAIMAPAGPAPKKAENSLARGCLFAFGILFIIGAIGTFASNDSASNAGYSSTASSSALSSAGSEPPPDYSPKLELLKWSWGEEYSFAIAEGQVKNVSSESLRSVQAVVTFYDKNGGFITSDDALIEFNPILPGQTSPFKVIATWNPAMKKAAVEFKEIFGGTIRHTSRE